MFGVKSIAGWPRLSSHAFTSTVIGVVSAAQGLSHSPFPYWLRFGSQTACAGKVRLLPAPSGIQVIAEGSMVKLNRVVSVTESELVAPPRERLGATSGCSLGATVLSPHAANSALSASSVALPAYFTKSLHRLLEFLKRLPRAVRRL